MGASLLSGRAIAAIRKQQANLFATGLAMADPPVALTLSRYDNDVTAWADLAPQDVLVRWGGDKGQNRSPNGSLSTALADSPTALNGTFSAVEPFDVRTGDRFALDGLQGHIGTVYPARNGRRVASFVIDADARSV